MMSSKANWIFEILLMSALTGFILTGCGGGSDTESLANIKEDPYALWKEQPNEKIVFMSKADSPQGELYLLDKSGQTTLLTNNNYLPVFRPGFGTVR